MKCAIIDDEPLALGLLESYVAKTPMLELCGKYASAVEAMGGLQSNPVDIIFLDIQMPDLNGLDFSKTIDTARTRIIFTTAFSQYALEGYKVNALDYLLKPVDADALDWCLNMMVAKHNEATKYEHNGSTEQVVLKDVNSDYLFVKSDYKLVRIDFSDILYIEGLKDYVKIYISSEPKPILCLSSMRSFENALPSDTFYRIHRSYIVNMQKVRVFEKGQVVVNGKYIPISDSYKEQVQTYLNKHLLQGR